MADSLCRVEDRNDPLMQKMRRYIQVFAREDEKGEKEGTQKADANLKVRPRNRRYLSGWKLIRQSALGADVEVEEPEDEQDIHFV